jgi:transposase InsO family protein
VVRTTVHDKALPCPLDRVNRQFKADRPNQLWVSDFTYVSTWQGWQYVAFVIDVYARRIVGWRVSSFMRTLHHLFVFSEEDKSCRWQIESVSHIDIGTKELSALLT